jgi:hypothetical protein
VRGLDVTHRLRVIEAKLVCLRHSTITWPIAVQARASTRNLGAPP